MKLRTSFFNAAVLKKDITRFAPAWGLYLTAMLLLMLTLFAEEHYDLASSLGMTINLLSVVNIGYALVCAALLFGDLFNSRLCNALHAMPMRREGWFLTHLVSGLLFSVAPNLVVGLCLMPRLGFYWFVALIWVGGMTATYLFFFGAAVLSAMCTGSRFAMVLVYGLINFLSILIMWTAQYLFEPLLYGIEINSEPFIFLSPVSYLCTHELNYLNFLDKIMSYYNPVNGWPYTLGIGAIGLVMLIGSLLIYRKRHLESAGDFITLRALSPVFLVLYTLAAGMVLFLFSRLFDADQDYLFLAVGIAAGFITGRMLLERTVRIFKPATFVGMAVLAAVLFGSLGLTRMDALGIVHYVPAEEKVSSVGISYGSSTEFAYTAEDVDEIRELMNIHQEFIDEDNRDAPTWYNSIYFTYTLDSGRTVTRKYRMDFTTQAAMALVPWFSRAEYVLKTDDVAGLIDRVKYVEVESYSDKYYSDNTVEPFQLLEKEEQIQALIDAIVADCNAGRMIQDYEYYDTYESDGVIDANAHPIGYITFHMEEGNNLFISIWESNESTYTWLLENMWS